MAASSVDHIDAPLAGGGPMEWYVGPGGGARPALWPSASIYRRRRLVAGAALVVVLALAGTAMAGMVSLGLRAGSALGGVPASAPERASDVPTYTVRAGDTLWSIAEQLAPDTDRRALVAALVERNGTDMVRVGQQLVLPVTASG